LLELLGVKVEEPIWTQVWASPLPASFFLKNRYGVPNIHHNKKFLHDGLVQTYFENGLLYILVWNIMV